MTYEFVITQGAQRDMEQCASQDRVAAACITNFLRERMCDPTYRACVIEEDYSDDFVENIAPLQSLLKQRINAYRVKMVNLSRWRLIFIVDHKSRRMGLFSVMHRDQDYQRDRNLWARIEREFDAHGFSTF